MAFENASKPPMTVGELRKLLEEHDPNMPIVLGYEGHAGQGFYSRIFGLAPVHVSDAGCGDEAQVYNKDGTKCVLLVGSGAVDY